VELADYATQFASRQIFAGVRETITPPLRLYRHILGSAFDGLPQAVRGLHDFDVERAAEGRGAVERGKGWIARRIARTFGFPEASEDTTVRVTFRRDGDREMWRRDFGGAEFFSIQEQGHGRSDRLLCERFGPCAFALGLVVDDGRLRFVIRRWSILGLPMPLWLAPMCDAYECETDGRFRFFVELRYRFIGLIVRYQGWLNMMTRPVPGGS
jgi:hypothetical protein